MDCWRRSAGGVRAAAERADEADEARLELESRNGARSVPRFGLNMLHHPRGARASQLIRGVRRTHGASATLIAQAGAWR